MNPTINESDELTQWTLSEGETGFGPSTIIQNFHDFILLAITVFLDIHKVVRESILPAVQQFRLQEAHEDMVRIRIF